jgi:DNA-binding NtrC family response regulator
MIEDDKMVGECYVRVLRRRGYAVTWASSVPQGREILARDPPHVLLLDRNVQGDIGWVLKDEAPSGTGTVLMSGHAPSGSPPYWMKSLSTDTLFEMIEDAASSATVED